MRLINPYFEFKFQKDFTLQGIKKHIEKCTRVSYKSENNITEDSADRFVDMLIKSDHLSGLEHGTVYLTIDKFYRDSNGTAVDCYSKYLENPYSAVHYSGDYGLNACRYYITTNYRVLVENDWLDDLQFLDTNIAYHIKRYSIKFICSRAISHQLVRHRVFSITQESQRYCNYSKGKFNNEVTFIIPSWTDIKSYKKEFGIPGVDNVIIRPREDDFFNMSKYTYFSNLSRAEEDYLKLINNGLLPEQAREVLPNSTKTEIIMTGSIPQWEALLKLRADRHADPEMQRLMIPLKENIYPAIELFNINNYGQTI